MKTCAEPRCPELVPKGETYCPHHWKAKRRASDAKRGSSTERGYDAKHRADRKAYFAAFPVCQDASGCIEMATDLDHIDGYPFNRDWSNYRALCGYHHKVRTARDQPGGWNKR